MVVKRILREEAEIGGGKNAIISKKSTPLSVDQIEFLISDSTMQMWAGLSIGERARRMTKLYPGEVHSAYQLR